MGPFGKYATYDAYLTWVITYLQKFGKQQSRSTKKYNNLVNINFKPKPIIISRNKVWKKIN